MSTILYPPSGLYPTNLEEPEPEPEHEPEPEPEPEPVKPKKKIVKKKVVA